ncbi:hypothetical protein, partial [Escherichia coli]|uniref:hypothetical protein n=1 Tax=Escherichia coli TaxID=562 RepID=UPI0028DE0053
AGGRVAVMRIAGGAATTRRQVQGHARGSIYCMNEQYMGCPIRASASRRSVVLFDRRWRGGEGLDHVLATVAAAVFQCTVRIAQG